MIDIAIHVAFATFSFFLSSLLIGGGIPHLRKKDAGGEEDAPPPRRGPVFDWRSAGLWIGMCEVALVFPLVYYKQFGALAIIFGAKEYVRKEDIRKDPSHYLLGTLVNLSVAVLLALLAERITSGAC